MEGARRAIHRKNFQPLNHISVRFADDYGQSEGAVDSGGPKRELFRLVMKELQQQTSIFTGEDGGRLFTLNTEGLKVSKTCFIALFRFFFRRLAWSTYVFW